MKQSNTFVFPAWKRWIGVAVVLLSLLSIAFFSYTKFEATRGAHAAIPPYIEFSVTNSDLNLVSFEVENYTLGTSSCTYNVGVTANPAYLGQYGIEYEYFVHGFTSKNECSGPKTTSQHIWPLTYSSCTFAFAPNIVQDNCKV
jgi:hypothetical protein